MKFECKLDEYLPLLTGKNNRIGSSIAIEATVDVCMGFSLVELLLTQLVVVTVDRGKFAEFVVRTKSGIYRQESSIEF